MEKTEFLQLRNKVVDAGHAKEIAWQESVIRHPVNADEFMWQYIWVVLSAGMKNQVVQIIEERIMEAYYAGKPIGSVFRHKGKVKAIEDMMADHDTIFKNYNAAPDRLAFLENLPYIGKITKFHLAKNLGEDVVKPDRHLMRIAATEGITPDELCSKLATQTGYRKATIDLILWRAANLGFV